MLRFPRLMHWFGLVLLSLAPWLACERSTAQAGVTSEEVEQAIRSGVKFLIERQRVDGSWPDAAANAPTGTTSLVTLALLTAGEPTDSPVIQKALTFLRTHSAKQLNSTYSVGLQTMVYAAAEPETDRPRIVANVDWLERTQHRDRREFWPGNWTYTDFRGSPGDNSNTQYALLGLNAASEAGVPVRPEVWALSRAYFEFNQNRDGGWGYTPRTKQSTASMTCAGIASLIFCGSRRFQSFESLQGEAIHHCGEGTFDQYLNRGIDWLATHFDVHQNIGHGQQYKIYYLYGLERAGRLAGVRFFGQNDWYRMGAEELVHTQNKLSGFWSGGGENEIVGTSLALLFLAKGRAPVLINKLSHLPRGDWNKDADDVRNLVGVVSREWKHLVTWQAVDPNAASVQDMLQAPIAYFNGHKAPEFSPKGRKNLRDFVEQGGFIFAEACCGSAEFDEGFKRLVKEVFPEEEYRLRPLSPEHAVWRAKHALSPDIHPLWGIEHGCRTVLIYSPQDLSCYWNQVERSPSNPAVIKAFRIGENVVDYATGREMPADKLTIHAVADQKTDAPRRGALRIAKLKYAGDWNIAPQAIPNLMETLRRPPFKFDVMITQKDLFARDTNLIYYPLVYIHGRTALQLDNDDIQALRTHLDPGSGTLFADAACGSAAFDASFRLLVAKILPDHPLVPIPRDDPLFSAKVGFNLKDVEYTAAAGGGRGFPQLEGVKFNDHWAIIYSKFDIGCALERHTGVDCKGYTHASAARIAANIVIYATLP
jgi:Domain of unknown function (DUF4159)/A-macroglobulin TED domain